MNEITKKYIKDHLNDDVCNLALTKFPDDIDKQLVVRQIYARQLLKKKLPLWSENDDLLFPKRLSLEQCSSELTAKYKSQLISVNSQQSTVNNQRSASTVLIDLTGGMGVDTSFLADNFDVTIYVEAQEELCALARHNFKVLNKNVKVVNAKAEDFLSHCDEVDCIYLDPARRDDYGRKMVSLHDCSPDVVELQDLLFKKAETIIVKLSPMLDIDIVKNELTNIKEIHIVAVKNECKELLVVLSRNGNGLHSLATDTVEVQALNILTTDLREKWNFTFTEDEERDAVAVFADVIENYLYEPGSALMKAGPFKLLSQRFNVKKLHRNTHLYTSDVLISEFPGRIFKVIDVIPFDKKTKKTLATHQFGRSGTLKASVAVRNFPLTADELRKNLAVKDGNDFYIFGTTLKDGTKVVILGIRNN